MIGMFDVDYYKDENGKKPAEEFTDSLDVKMRAKVLHNVDPVLLRGRAARHPDSRLCEEDAEDTGPRDRPGEEDLRGLEEEK